MTYEEIEKHYPEEFARRSIDKLAYRYPRCVLVFLHVCVCVCVPPPPRPQNQHKINANTKNHPQKPNSGESYLDVIARRPPSSITHRPHSTPKPKPTHKQNRPTHTKTPKKTAMTHLLTLPKPFFFF